MKTVLKRVIAAIGILLSFSTLSGGLREFSSAVNGIDIFQGLFFIVIGGFALVLFIDDFRYKKWPFGGK